MVFFVCLFATYCVSNKMSISWRGGLVNTSSSTLYLSSWFPPHFWRTVLPDVGFLTVFPFSALDLQAHCLLAAKAAHEKPVISYWGHLICNDWLLFCRFQDVLFGVPTGVKQVKHWRLSLWGCRFHPGLVQWVKEPALLQAAGESQMRLRSGVATAVAQPSAAAPIRPLDWELPYAASTAIKIKKKKSALFRVWI